MIDRIDEAIRGVMLAYSIVYPNSTDSIFPVPECSDGVAAVIAVFREYAEVCRTCLDVCEIPVELGPSIGFAAGFFESTMIHCDAAMLPEGDEAAGMEDGNHG